MTDSKYGEQLFKQLMEQRGHTVEDLTLQKEFQILDIDFSKAQCFSPFFL